MKKSIIALLAMALALVACAESVSPEMAMAAANAWVVKNGKFDSGRVATGRVITVRDTNKAQTILWYQVSMSGDGCLVMAPVTEIEPVVVALDNDPGELPAAHPLRGILMGDMRKRLRFLGLYQEDAAATLQSVKPGAAPAVDPNQKLVAAEWAQQQQAKWGRLGVGKAATLQAGEASVGRDTVEQEVCVVKGFERNGPLTHWDQGSNGGLCYNYYTPDNVVCGCVATACAALVQFFGATNSVEGISGNCHYEGAPYPCKTKGGAIDWSLFDGCKRRSDYSRLSEEQREVLGRVAYDAGVGVSMSWAAAGSGAYEEDIATTLKNVFGFKYARYVGFNNPEKPGEENLRKFIYGQCAAGAPVGMSIEGHSVVAVGYGIDREGVERVRVFMGWGGSGDGWYALPYIDTKSVAGGATYLSEVVDGVITMVNYHSADIVPVVGQVTAPGASLVFRDVLSWQEVEEDQEVVDEETGAVTTNRVTVRKPLPRVVETDDNGWFATRVPPDAGTHPFTIAGKVGEYTIGSAAQSSGNASRLRAALPDWFMPFPLLNSSVAFTFEGAVRLALAEDKAILRVSGVSGDTNTQCVLNHIFELDAGNVNDFTNRFVYYYTGFLSTNADMRPSYAVILPQTARAEERWYVDNGRLAYGYARFAPTKTKVTITNIVEEVVYNGNGMDDDDSTHIVATTNIVTAFTTNVTITTYAPTGATADIETFQSWPELDAAAADKYVWSVDQVLDMGWEEYTRKSTDISVTVVSSEEPATGTPSPNWGVTKDIYKVGDVIVATAPAEATNTTKGVVMGCKGYRLDCENAITGAAYHREGTETRVELPAAEKGDHFTITWVTGITAVKIDVTVSPKASAGTYSPAAGWYKCGESVVFTATPSENYGIERWNGSGASTGAGVKIGGSGCPSVYVMPTEKTSLNISFRQKTKEEIKNPPQDGTNYQLKVSSYFLGVDGESYYLDGKENTSPDLPAIVLKGYPSVEGIEIKNGSTVSVTNLTLGMLLKPEIYTDRRGDKWQCAIWNLYDFELGEDPAHDDGVLGNAAVQSGFSFASGEGPFWGLKMEQDAKLVLYWVPVPEEEEEDPINPNPEDVMLEINWNDALNNLHSGDYVVLTADKAKQLDPRSKIDLGLPPLGWKTQGELKKASDGSLTVALELDEAVLAPKGVGEVPPLTIFNNADGTLTVKAEVSNGVRGFWYSLYTADQLTGSWNVVKSGYEEGEPVKQANLSESVGPFEISIIVNPEEAKRFYKLVVSEKNPSEE